MKIYVLRHGVTALNLKKIPNGQIDEPLLPQGINQAKQAIPLIPKSIKFIYTSPFLRAKQTAEIINSSFKLPLVDHTEIGEIHMGSLAGMPWSEMPAGVDTQKKHRAIQFDYRPHGGESANEVKKRVLNFLKEIIKKHKDFEVLIVTHGGIIRTLHYLEHGEQLSSDIENASIQIFNLKKILKKAKP